MPIPIPKRVKTGVELLEKIQDSTRDAFLALGPFCPLLTGVLVKAELKPNADTRVDHGLGRVPLGYLVAHSNQPGVVYDSDAQNDLADSQLILRTSATSSHRVTLWVFG